MASPFPGMDPYLEPHWLDVQTALIGEARRLLNRSLPPGLVARAEERVAIESPEDYYRRIGPGVRVLTPVAAAPEELGDLLIEAPYKLVVEVDPLIERYIRILDEAGTLITTVEFLSTGNKRGTGLTDYREKRQQLLQAGVHVVEVDLVRDGDWRALIRLAIVPTEAASAPYRAVVHAAGRRPTVYLFPIRLQDPLPEVPVPLRPGEMPVKLPLQPMMDAVYADGRYDATLDYHRPLDPPFDGDDAIWLADRVAVRA